MKQASATIDLTQLAHDSKELVQSMTQELEGYIVEEPASDSRWPARFISAGTKGAAIRWGTRFTAAGGKGAPPRWGTRFVAAGPKSAPTRD
jgi:hypothetical protein